MNVDSGRYKVFALKIWGFMHAVFLFLSKMMNCLQDTKIMLEHGV